MLIEERYEINLGSAGREDVKSSRSRRRDVDRGETCEISPRSDRLWMCPKQKKTQSTTQLIIDMPPPAHRAQSKANVKNGVVAAGPPANKVRVYILTAAFTAITATGAWYGAGLKADQEAKKEREVAMQATFAERIEQLENMRARLLRQKSEIQVKIDRLAARTEQASNGSPGETA
nr:hypothetical protein CFP56_53216 [Quercus suber]